MPTKQKFTGTTFLVKWHQTQPWKHSSYCYQLHTPPHPCISLWSQHTAVWIVKSTAYTHIHVHVCSVWKQSPIQKSQPTLAEPPTLSGGRKTTAPSAKQETDQVNESGGGGGDGGQGIKERRDREDGKDPEGEIREEDYEDTKQMEE